jgi:hypothetical protein
VAILSSSSLMTTSPLRALWTSLRYLAMMMRSLLYLITS